MLTLLASYPKSGNTWIRTFLTNYLSDSDQPASINALTGGSILCSREMFDDEMGVDSSVLTNDEIDLWRPLYCRTLADELPEPTFVKIHDAYTFNKDEEPLFPADAIKSVIYSARNPLDVSVSYAHHSGRNLDDTLDIMGNKKALMGPQEGRLQFQLHQRLLSWTDHLASWLDQKDMPVHLVKYEDLLADAHGTFEAMLIFSGIPVDAKRLDFAVEASTILSLKEQEKEFGFAERNPISETFFRQGTRDSWREALSETQVRRLVGDHGDMMKRLGYL